MFCPPGRSSRVERDLEKRNLPYISIANVSRAIPRKFIQSSLVDLVLLSRLPSCIANRLSWILPPLSTFLTPFPFYFFQHSSWILKNFYIEDDYPQCIWKYWRSFPVCNTNLDYRASNCSRPLRPKIFQTSTESNHLRSSRSFYRYRHPSLPTACPGDKD